VIAAVVAAVALAGCAGAVRPGDASPADLVLLGGTILTMDPAAPTARAVAIRGGRIVAVGDDATARAWIGRDTKVIELGGRGVTPGLVDAHVHIHGLGEALEALDLRGETEAAIAAKVAAAAAAGGAEPWIVGRGWDQNLWPGQAFPTAATLDRAAPGRPVALERVDGHALWVSSAALAAAGIDERTRDPDGGKLERDGRGRPTGVLIDNAMLLVTEQMPEPTAAVRTRRILRGAEAAIAAGLTGVHEMGIDDATVDAYRALADQGRLPIRVTAYLEGTPAAAEALRDRIADVDRAGDAPFALVGMKLFADGALGSRGARLLAPYADAPGQLGLWVTEPATLTRAVEAATTAGWQVAVHAIGDAGVRATLDAFAAGAALRKDARPRVEHTQVIAAEDVPRMKAIGAIASMQPVHATSDMPWAEARLGPERLAGAYAWRTILDAGIPLALGSDAPVERISVLGALWAATTRQDLEGRPPGGWTPSEKLTLEEALAGFTTGAAYAVHAERVRGRIAVGQVADLTVYDRPLEAARLRETRIDRTIVGGRVVFERR
jgi:predicted amidohydrolase YtcJ